MSNFSFLNDKWPELAGYGYEAEQKLYSETKYTYLNVRNFAETFVNIIMEYEKLSNSYGNNTLFNNLKTLEADGVLPIHLIGLLHKIRKSGKVGAHPDPEGLARDVINALQQLFYSYQLGIWLKQNYDDYQYEPIPFRIPDKSIDLKSSNDDFQRQLEELQEQLKDLKYQMERSQLKAVNDKINTQPANMKLTSSLEQPGSQQNEDKKFSIDDLKRKGFVGFIGIGELWDQGCGSIPNEQGVYAVLRDSTDPPEFLSISVGGWFKGKDPTVGDDALHKCWVIDTGVLYFGKAGGTKSKSTLRHRITDLLKFGQGRPVGHWGGRYIWQLKDYKNLIIAYKPLPNDDPETLEKSLIKEFETLYGRKPYANLRG